MTPRLPRSAHLVDHFRVAWALSGNRIHLLEPTPEPKPDVDPDEFDADLMTRSLCGKPALETPTAAGWWPTPAHRCRACVRVAIARLQKRKGT